MKLKEQTEQLKQELNLLKDRYVNNQPPEDKRDKAFFLFVKEYTAPIYKLLENWEAAALKTVKERKVTVHPHQVTSTRENMELILMHSFYIDVKRKRYMELNHSVHFIFDQLLHEL
ncbi:DUF1798 family protein [Virgibacillus oceani]|uniref:DUF1798 domain-containing protein n=1 Tax=Virgibacillus oceani TaxID=1479511 RepID=A0A917LXJ7_9BACI|nr:DUF1798 family protein [Virgibacillus oceani]GGG65585.1 hypothetical protein GCM10011398_06540 [Virgibacillus oceani]